MYNVHIKETSKQGFNRNIMFTNYNLYKLIQYHWHIKRTKCILNDKLVNIALEIVNYVPSRTNQLKFINEMNQKFISRLQFYQI